MIGWASTPYNYEWAYTHPKKSAAMSAAGPISNFILLFISAIIIHVGIYFGFFLAPESINISNVVQATNPETFESLAKIISIMFSLNLILFVFNLIPLPPLDGSGILPMFMGEKTGRKYMDLIRSSGLSMIGLFIAWKLFDLF
jgi:Zn-dependent protease